MALLLGHNAAYSRRCWEDRKENRYVVVPPCRRAEEGEGPGNSRGIFYSAPGWLSEERWKQPPKGVPRLAHSLLHGGPSRPIPHLRPTYAPLGEYTQPRGPLGRRAAVKRCKSLQIRGVSHNISYL